MRELYLLRKGLSNQGASFAKIVNLLVELRKVRSALVVNKSFRNQADAERAVAHADTEFNIFRITVEAESACAFKYFSG